MHHYVAHALFVAGPELSIAREERVRPQATLRMHRLASSSYPFIAFIASRA